MTQRLCSSVQGQTGVGSSRKEVKLQSKCLITNLFCIMPVMTAIIIIILLQAVGYGKSILQLLNWKSTSWPCRVDEWLAISERWREKGGWAFHLFFFFKPTLRDPDLTFCHMRAHTLTPGHKPKHIWCTLSPDPTYRGHAYLSIQGQIWDKNPPEIICYNKKLSDA